MKLARRQQCRPAFGIKGTMCGRRDSDEERRGSPYYVVWTQPSCISNVCLHKPWALAMCSSTQRDAICPCKHTQKHTLTDSSQSTVACLTNWAHLFAGEIFIEQLSLPSVSCCFSFRGFLPSSSVCGSIVYSRKCLASPHLALGDSDLAGAGSPTSFTVPEPASV